MLFNRRVVNYTAKKTKNTNVVFVEVLERQDKLLMSRRVGGHEAKTSLGS